jgi:hypothetical protein
VARPGGPPAAAASGRARPQRRRLPLDAHRRGRAVRHLLVLTYYLQQTLDYLVDGATELARVLREETGTRFIFHPGMDRARPKFWPRQWPTDLTTIGVQLIPTSTACWQVLRPRIRDLRRLVELPDTTRALIGVIEFDKINQTLIGMTELQDQVNAHRQSRTDDPIWRGSEQVRTTTCA